jgi:predicted amidohydrolase YtcJ
MAAHFSSETASGALPQRVWLAGKLELAEAPAGPWHLGPAKLHLHEAQIPEFDEAVGFIAAAHEQDRPIAIHCVSEVELVFALAALEASGTRRGDRIEHASVASNALVTRIADLGLQVCVQPHFVAERGDEYLADVEPRHHGQLYRLRSFPDSAVAVVGGSDAPFGSADPWNAMAAAVSRRTRSGQAVAPAEALTPEQALALYLADPADLARIREIAVGAPADLVLLDRPWEEARAALSADLVRTTIIGGRVVHDRVD